MRNYIGFLKFFYKLLKRKFIFLVILMMLAAFFEGLGATLLLPILQQAGSGTIDNPIMRAFDSFAGILNIDFTLQFLLVFFLLFFIIRSIFLIWQGTYVVKIQADLLVKLRMELVTRFFKTRYKYFLNKDTGYLNNAAIVEFQNVCFAFKTFASVLVKSMFTLVYLILPLLVDFRIAFLIILFASPVIIITRKINHKVMKYSTQTSGASAGLQKFLIQTLNHFKYFKATDTYENIIKKVFSQTKKLGELSYHQEFWAQITQYGFEPLIVLIIIILILYHTQVVGGKIMEIAFILYLFKRAGAQMLGIPQSYRKFLMSYGSIDVFNKLDKELKENEEDFKENLVKPDFSKSIRFNQAYFSYNTEHVLKNLNIEILPRKTVAFVGSTGAGKSTVANLITGILPPTNGDILFGGTSYRKINQKYLRKNIGYMTQENVVFNDTIMNNITLWENNPDKKRVEETCKKAHIKEFIEKLPDKYDTLLGDNGINISGGERQRLSIARELYKDVKMLIFDEATSNLDSSTENKIQKNIDDLHGEKTIIMIAHRLSTVKNSDKIFVMKDGEIVEQGSYNYLYRLKGEFRRMVEEQQLSKNEEFD